MGRTVIAAWFIMTPMTPTTVLIFSAAMDRFGCDGSLTSGLIAHIYGLRIWERFMGSSSFSLGSFAGVWLGGKMYDVYGGALVWWVGVGVAFSARSTCPSTKGAAHSPLIKGRHHGVRMGIGHTACPSIT